MVNLKRNREQTVAVATAIQRGRRGGFALLDVMIGGLVLAMALTVIFGLSSGALQAQAKGERRQQAAQLADSLLNQVLALGPDNYTDVFATSGRADPPYENFDYEILLEDKGIGHPFDVTVLIRWSMGSRGFEESFETKIAPMLGEYEEDERIPEQPVDRDQ